MAGTSPHNQAPSLGEPSETPERWLRAKLRRYHPGDTPQAAQAMYAIERAVLHTCPDPPSRVDSAGNAIQAGEALPLFENPFEITDLLVFDHAALRDMLACNAHGLTLDCLAAALHGAPPPVTQHIRAALPTHQRRPFTQLLTQPISATQANYARSRLLDNLFWELTYWKTPNLYEALIEGEHIHPGIFRRLTPDICGKDVLDAGAGSGRATFACLRAGAHRVYAVEPSPGLLRILKSKCASYPAHRQIIPARGRFDHLPLEDDSVDLALSCSAFTADPDQGGEPGLAELRRVTRAGGKIILIWPRPQDYAWLAAHGFHYVALPAPPDMAARFRSLATALQVARRFYAHNTAAIRYLLRRRRPEIPFSILGVNPPHDYCWLPVEKENSAPS
ncbi:MAG: class I SAM-dependent methyltransferase [Ktedonobacterales bacterium]